MRLILAAAVLLVGCGGKVVSLPSEEELAPVPVAGSRVFAATPFIPIATLAKKGPPYPVVLAHGFFGFEQFAGVDQVTYFFGVKDYLAQHGETQVFTPAVDPFNDSQQRGAQLLARVKEVLAQTNAAKVILIGHSQGGLDSRVVAHDRPDLVAAVYTVGTPHHGTPLGDVGTRVVSDPSAQAAVDALVRLVGGVLWTESRKETSIFGALKQFATPGITAFNATYPDAPGVPYFSVAGRSGMRDGKGECDVAGRPSYITEWDKTLDPTNPGLSATELYLEKNAFSPLANDGLVPVSSAKWGTFLGCVPADHLDEIGQLFGASPGLLNNWDHQKFYLDVIRSLRAQGL